MNSLHAEQARLCAPPAGSLCRTTLSELNKIESRDRREGSGEKAFCARNGTVKRVISRAENTN